MPRLSQEQREDIRNALILGDSQYKVSQDYEVSSATVNKIFKTIPKDDFLKNEVKEEIAIKSKLLEVSERNEPQSKSLVKAFDDKVNEDLRRMQLVFNAQEKAVVKLDTMIDKTDDPQDMKYIVDSIDKASITLGVSQRHANSNINVNTQNNQVQNNSVQVEWE